MPLNHSLLSDFDQRLIASIRSRNLTYLSQSALASIVSTIKQIDRKGVPGIIIEAGCALGGSSILISKIKAPSRLLSVYDVFEMIPAPGKNDTKDVHQRYKEISSGNSMGIGGDLYYGYQKDLYSVVVSNFAEFQINVEESDDVELVKGLLQDTLNVSRPVAFAHIDVDWYEPVMTCIERIWPQLSVGGSIILDDYYDWGGCRKAANQFFQKHIGSFELDNSAGTLKITRV